MIVRVHGEGKQEMKEKNQLQNGINNNGRVRGGEKQHEVQKNQVNFKNAVHDNANNIRMETSKISIKNSGDLKNIISYKDLRDLLQNVRRHQ